MVTWGGVGEGGGERILSKREATIAGFDPKDTTSVSALRSWSPLEGFDVRASQFSNVKETCVTISVLASAVLEVSFEMNYIQSVFKTFNLCIGRT